MEVNDQILIDFHKTEIGILPKDWHLRPISNIGEIRGRVGWKGYTKKDLVYYGAYAIGAKHINKSNKLDLSDPTYISNNKYIESPEIMVFRNDILIVQRGTIGKVVLIDAEIGEATINPSMVILRLKNSIPKFVYYYLLSKEGQNQIVLDTSSTGVPMITQKQIENFIVPLPPLPEQTAIAEVLSNTDNLIQALEKKIAKKRNIKKGAMQKLLQPKEGWEVKKLGEVVELITKGTTPTSLGREFQNNGINFIKIESLSPNGDIIPEKVAYIDEYTHQLLKRSQLKNGDILFSIAGALGRVAIVKNEILPANTNQALSVIRLKINSEIDLNYLLIYLTSERIQTHILNVSVQGAQANLSLLNISHLLIEIPKFKTEQTRIATILSDMDNELNTLETKLNKFKMLKLGMMQNLLTGKIRLNKS